MMLKSQEGTGRSLCAGLTCCLSPSAPEPAHQDVLPAEPAAVPASSQVRPQVPYP